jgi:hypothetical protein
MRAGRSGKPGDVARLRRSRFRIRPPVHHRRSADGRPHIRLGGLAPKVSNGRSDFSASAAYESSDASFATAASMSRGRRRWESRLAALSQLQPVAVRVLEHRDIAPRVFEHPGIELHPARLERLVRLPAILRRGWCTPPGCGRLPAAPARLSLARLVPARLTHADVEDVASTRGVSRPQRECPDRRATPCEVPFRTLG